MVCHRCILGAAALLALAASAAHGYEPIEQMLPTDLGAGNPPMGRPLEPPVIWPADDASLQLHPPPLVGLQGSIPTYPEGFTDPDILLDDGKPPPRHVWPYKSGFFQKISVVGGWIPDAGSNDLEITELDALVSVALPLPTPDFPLLITPSFETRLLAGPIQPDLPPRLYGAAVQFMWVPKISERLVGVLAVEPGVFSDFEGYESSAWRTLGRAIVRYDWIPDRLQVGLGVLYLDRDDFNYLPVGGVIWMPIDDVRLELIFPQPRLAYRLGWNGRREDWLYLAGEIGGDSYSFERASGVRENAALFDVRLNLGIERQHNGGAGARLEVGYVFAREIDYFSLTPDVSLNPTIMVRAGFSL